MWVYRIRVCYQNLKNSIFKQWQVATRTKRDHTVVRHYGITP